jgi:hypothetical protein
MKERDPAPGEDSDVLLNTRGFHKPFLVEEEEALYDERQDADLPARAACSAIHGRGVRSRTPATGAH